MVSAEHLLPLSLILPCSRLEEDFFLMITLSWFCMERVLLLLPVALPILFLLLVYFFGLGLRSTEFVQPSVDYLQKLKKQTVKAKKVAPSKKRAATQQAVTERKAKKSPRPKKDSKSDDHSESDGDKEVPSGRQKATDNRVDVKKVVPRKAEDGMSKGKPAVQKAADRKITMSETKKGRAVIAEDGPQKGAPKSNREEQQPEEGKAKRSRTRKTKVADAKDESQKGTPGSDGVTEKPGGHKISRSEAKQAKAANTESESRKETSKSSSAAQNVGEGKTGKRETKQVKTTIARDGSQKEMSKGNRAMGKTGEPKINRSSEGKQLATVNAVDEAQKPAAEESVQKKARSRRRKPKPPSVQEVAPEDDEPFVEVGDKKKRAKRRP
uniref:Uncharacterized protein n=1 Tax=Trichuris muris TaxID=70415 RepID=A0A5S6Q8I1_TRIMR